MDKLNRKSFFKFGVLVPAFLTFGFSSKPKVEVKKLNCVIFNSEITRNFLIPGVDSEGNKYWDTNQYGKYFKPIGEVILTNEQGLMRRIRFESKEMFTFETIEKAWNDFDKKVKHRLETEKFEITKDSITQMPSKFFII